MVVQISREGWGVRRALGNRQSVQIVYRDPKRSKSLMNQCLGPNRPIFKTAGVATNNR